MQMRAEIQALEDSPLKKDNSKISFATVSFIVKAFGKEVESKPSRHGQDGRHTNSTVLILGEKVRVLGVPRTPGI